VPLCPNVRGCDVLRS